MSHPSRPTGKPLQPHPHNLGGQPPHVPLAERAPQPRPGLTNPERDHPHRVINALPPLASLTGGPTGSGADERPSFGSPSAWRSAGLHSILNPPSDPFNGSANQPASLSSGHGPEQTQSRGPALYGSPRGRKRNESVSPKLESSSQMTARTGRPMLSPRSPSLRAASLSAHRSPSMGAVLRTHAVPTDTAAYGVASGARRDSAVPPVSCMPPPFGSHHAVPGGDSIPAQRQPNNSSAMPYHPTAFSTTSATSRSASQIEYTKSSPVSPSSSLPHSAQAQPLAIKTEMPASFQPFQGAPVGQGMPHVQSGWKMAIETQQGRELLDVDIDYQQASKMADEKRRRNAGASARFRARRKEKEKEASQMISGLQQELREMADDRDFYVTERNYFRDLWARSNPGPLPSRPISPLSRKPRPTRPPGPESHHSFDDASRSSEESTHQRRRTGDYQPSYAGPPPTAPSYPPSYPPGGGPPSNQQYSYPAPGAGPYAEPRPAGPPSQLSIPRPPSLAPAHSQPMDAFRRDALDRNWNPGRP